MRQSQSAIEPKIETVLLIQSSSVSVHGDPVTWDDQNQINSLIFLFVKFVWFDDDPEDKSWLKHDFDFEISE